MGRDAAKPYFVDVPAQVQSHSVTSPETLVDYYVGLLVDGLCVAQPASCDMNWFMSK